MSISAVVAGLRSTSIGKAFAAFAPQDLDPPKARAAATQEQGITLREIDPLPVCAAAERQSQASKPVQGARLEPG